MAAKADQGTISSGSISRIVQNTIVNMCTNFGAFMNKINNWFAMLQHYLSTRPFACFTAHHFQSST